MWKDFCTEASMGKAYDKEFVDIVLDWWQRHPKAEEEHKENFPEFFAMMP